MEACQNSEPVLGLAEWPSAPSDLSDSELKLWSPTGIAYFEGSSF